MASARLRFVISTERSEHAIQEAFGAILRIRDDLGNGFEMRSGGTKRWQPTIIHICAAAEMKRPAEEILEINSAVRREFDRGLLSGTNLLVAYCGPVEGRLPAGEFVDAISVFEQCFDLVILISDSDARGRRYTCSHIRKSISGLLRCMLGSRSAREFLLDVAGQTHPKNRRITFALATLDVSQATLRSIAYSHFSKELFGCIFKSEDTEGCCEARLVEPDHLDVQYRRGGSFKPVGESLSLLEQRLASDWRAARGREIAESTRSVLSRHAGKPSSGVWQKLMSGAAAIIRRLAGRRPQRRAHAKSQNVIDQKAKTFQQLLRVKQIELRLQPALGSLPQGTGPLNKRLGDPGFGREELFERLPDASQVAWQIAQQISLQDLLSGLASPEKLAECLDEHWQGHHIEDLLEEFVESEELERHLETLASRVSPVFPSASGSPGKLLLVPPEVVRVTAPAGYQAARGFAGQYQLLVADDCLDLECLRNEGGLTDD